MRADHQASNTARMANLRAEEMSEKQAKHQAGDAVRHQEVRVEETARDASQPSGMQRCAHS